MSLYIYLPDEYLPRIKIAEQFTEEGDREYRELKKLVSRMLV